MESHPQTNLYRERASAKIEQGIEALQQIENGVGVEKEWSPVEREEIVGFENNLGEKIESIYALKSIITVISLTYLGSESGRADFENVFGITPPLEGSSDDELCQFLYQNESVLKSVNAKARAEFEGRAQSQVEQEIVAKVADTVTEDFHIDSSVITEPTASRILLTPEKSLEKIIRLRELKQELKQLYAQLGEEPTTTSAVKKGLIDLYVRRINETLSQISQTGRSLQKKVELGIELTDTEYELYSQLYQAEDFDRVISRYDRFEHGASSSPDEHGNYRQISTELASFTEQHAQEYNQSIMSAHALMEQKGIDPALAEDEQGYQPTEIQQLAEEILASYDLLSSESPDTYDPTRVGPASDDKWQVIISDQFNSMSVNGKQRVVKIPNKPMSARRLFTVGLAHEIEGHVLQHTNTPKLGLRLFQKTGSDRSSMFAEGGAKYNEDLVSREAFGVPSTSHPHYIRAMQTRLDGGTYADCVNTFYESSIEPYRTLYGAQQLSKEEMQSVAHKQLKLAVNRSRRLFRGGSDKTNEAGYLGDSRDTAYLEGHILSQKLTEANLQKYMFLTGVNMDALTFLLKNNLIKTDDITGPSYKTLDIWERERARFELKT